LIKPENSTQNKEVSQPFFAPWRRREVRITSTQKEYRMSLQISRSAPLFSLKNSHGKDISPADFRGQWVVLYFYPKDDTSGCTQEAIDFTRLIPEFSEKGAVVIGISPDSPESHLKFIGKHGLTVELLSDPDHVACLAYGVWQKKRLYGKEYYGVVRTTVLIDPEGTVRHVWEKVKVPGHAGEVMDKVCALR
jgi:peroxiredoxin Q/BCP